jgi:galactokinase
MGSFKDIYSCDWSIQAEAPGRVNLIGEHTDYNGGFVLPAAIPQRTRTYLAVRPGSRVRACSAAAGGGVVEYELGREEKGRGWLDYVQGATALLAAEGHKLDGFDLFITSDVPLGSGLSSSAALGVSLLRALRQAFGLRLDDIGLAQLWQRVENRFVGAQVGIMDPMACALCAPGTALFLDAQSLRGELVPLPPAAEWVVINSGVSHEISAGDYNTRRAECERACALLGISSLRALNETDLPHIELLPEPLRRRVRHVVTENARVLAAVAALRGNDLPRLGALFNASHDSQRDDYEVSVPAIDALIKRARQEPGVFGARLTGGGFGGSIVLFTTAGSGREIAEHIAADYAAQTGHQPTILVPEPRCGAAFP